MDDTVSERERALLADLGEQFATAISTLLGRPHAITSGDQPGTADLIVRFRVSGAGSGAMCLALNGAEAGAVARRVMGLDDDPSPAVVHDTFRELCAQAAGALGQRPVAAGLTLGVDAIGGAEIEAQPGDVAGSTITFGDDLVLHVTVWSRAILPDHAPQIETRRHAPVSVVEGTTQPPARPSGGSDNLDVILDIELPTSIRFGQTEMALQALTRLGPGSVIDLGRSPDDPVEVLVSGRMVARGEVVVVAGNYGVRITEVISRPDRLVRLDA